ncbi:hypothetical protein [Phenylobacterium sp.]|uniref:hypothetical protein n=1 Tax=Phenylobacterium sp. TaxID=1871053 RepID=UPI003BA95590
MPRHLWLILACLLSAGAAEGADYKAPRNAVGQPDLQGVWTNTSLTWLQRAPIFKGLVATEAEEKMMMAGFKQMAGGLLDTHVDPNLPAPPVVKDAPQADILEMDLKLARIGGQPRSSWIIDPADGKLPFTDAGKKAARQSGDNYDGPEGRPLEERCLIAIGSSEGPPMMNTGFNGHYQIVQTKDHVAIHIEMNHDVRIIRLTDKRRPPAGILPWMGDSIGWWEGDTLVVETVNFHPKTYIGSLTGGFMWSPKGRLVERFTRTGPNDILYEFAAEDPVMFTKPWKAQMPLRAAKGPIYEYACHEGNYSLPNALTGARYEEKNPPPPEPATPGMRP